MNAQGDARPRVALTHSAWINAWTLQQACAPLGVGLRLAGPAEGFPIPLLAAGERPDWVCFTEEASLAQALRAPPAAAFLPTQFPAELLDDKWAFAEFVATVPGAPPPLRQWPLDGPVPHAAFPVILKARRSWKGALKLPRGWVCADSAALQARRNTLANEGFEAADFFVQEWLGSQPHRVLSVCGFFDAEQPARNLMLLTERVMAYGDGPASSAAVASVPDTEGLIASAGAVLAQLGFRGAFELEFLGVPGRTCVIELNPRFWMQHGLFLALDNSLVKRYLGQDTEADHRREAAAPARAARLLWMDGVWLLRRLLRADPRLLRLVWHWVLRLGHRPVLCPRPGYLVRLALRRAWGRVAGSGA